MLTTKNATVTATNIRSNIDVHSVFMPVRIERRVVFIEATEESIKATPKAPKTLLTSWLASRCTAG
jgi:hypothetical protein